MAPPTKEGMPTIILFPRYHNPAYAHRIIAAPIKWCISSRYSLTLARARSLLSSSTVPEDVVRMMLYLLETATRRMKPPVEKFCFLIQFDGFALKNVDYNVLKQIIDILQVRELS